MMDYDGAWIIDSRFRFTTPGPDTMHNYFKLMSGKKKVDLL